ncbi:MAG: glucose 1-dehydrogenase [Deltaproteobacteria bacterium]|nr:glucose 1-dehydrogenase [Deltaproteobacteria bacterium]
MANKIAVVTGGAGGIGKAVVSRLARAGFDVCIVDQNDKAGQELVELMRQQKYNAEFYRVDLKRAAEIKILFDSIYGKFQRIDVLVNLAGGTLHKHPITEFPLSEWREVIDVNLKATFLCCQAVSKGMREAKSGVIINTSSNFGITGSAGRTAYSAAKAAIIAFTKSLALEMAPYGVRVNTIAPGLTATERVMAVHSDEEWRRLSTSMPLGRAGQPSDIAEGVNFLAGDESAFMTGQLLHVNGGMVFN